MKVGDLIEDRHYGLGTVLDMHRSARGEWAKVLFPQFPHLAPGGVINLWNEHVRELKIISSTCKKVKKSENNLNMSEYPASN
tara:strand:+ start:1282 stop:1527 length:246 start_codon:yes stop_codon:yes gene_type:complete